MCATTLHSRPEATHNVAARGSASATWRAAILYAALTIALAYPLSIRLATDLMSPAPDTELTMWALAWDAHAFVRQPLAIFDANIYYPQHLTLAYSENFIGSALAAAPVLWLTGNPVLALNLVSLASVVLCGLGAYVLARRIGASPAGAALSGIVFAFAPPRFLRLDQLHLATIQWLPFCLAYLLAYLDERRPRDLRLAAVFFSLQALSSGHGAVFLVVAALLAVGYRIGRRRSSGHRDPLTAGAVVRDLGAIGALALVPTALMFVPYILVQREMGLKRSLENWSVSWASFLASPSHLDAWLLSLVPGARINETADAYLFPGVGPILLAGAAFMWRRAAVHTSALRQKPDTAYALLVTMVAVWLSVGRPLGIWPLVYWLPGLNLIRVPSRFMLLATLGVALLAGIGFDRLADRCAAAWPGRTGVSRDRRRQLAIAIGALLVVEFASMPFETTPYTVAPPAIDRWLATRPAPFAVAEVPLPSPADLGAWERRQTMFMLHSTAHWQQTVHGYSGFRPPLHERLFAALTTFPSEASIRSLTDLSVSYLVVHTDLYAPEEWLRIEKAIERLSALKLEHVEGAGRVYSLPR
jgi:hypothetical protein